MGKVGIASGTAQPEWTGDTDALMLRAALTTELHLRWGLTVFERAALGGSPLVIPHHLSESIDAVNRALNAAGLDTDEKRDAERARITERDMAEVAKVIEYARMGDKTAQGLLDARGLRWEEPSPVNIPDAEP